MKALFLLMLFLFSQAGAEETSKIEWQEIREGVWVKHTPTIRYTIQKQEHGGFRYSVDKPCPPPLENHRVVYTGLAQEPAWKGSGCNGRVGYTNAKAWISTFHPLPPELQQR